MQCRLRRKNWHFPWLVQNFVRYIYSFDYLSICVAFTEDTVFFTRRSYLHLTKTNGSKFVVYFNMESIIEKTWVQKVSYCILHYYRNCSMGSKRSERSEKIFMVNLSYQDLLIILKRKQIILLSVHLLYYSKTHVISGSFAKR